MQPIRSTFAHNQKDTYTYIHECLLYFFDFVTQATLALNQIIASVSVTLTGGLCFLCGSLLRLPESALEEIGDVGGDMRQQQELPNANQDLFLFL